MSIKMIRVESEQFIITYIVKLDCQNHGLVENLKLETKLKLCNWKQSNQNCGFIKIGTKIYSI